MSDNDEESEGKELGDATILVTTVFEDLCAIASGKTVSQLALVRSAFDIVSSKGVSSDIGSSFATESVSQDCALIEFAGYRTVAHMSVLSNVRG